MGKPKKEETCEDRIDDCMKSVIKYMREMYAVYTGENRPAGEITEDSFSEYGLSFDYVDFEAEDKPGYFRYQLSWGGPSDEFRFYCDSELHCHCVEYVFMDWFDGATRELRGKDKRFLLEIFNDYFKDSGVAETVFADSLVE